MCICYHLHFQQPQEELDMNLKYVYLEEYITVLYHLQNMRVNVQIIYYM